MSSPLFLLCLISPIDRAFGTEIRLDDREWLARAALVGIQHAQKSTESIVVKTGSSPSFEAYIVFPVEGHVNPQTHTLLEITMKTNPRIHRFKFLWRPIGAGPSDTSYFLEHPIFLDNAFHTYSIPLDVRPSWKEGISEIALGWHGTFGLIEITKISLRAMTFGDRIRVSWSRFWIPEGLNPAMTNAIGGATLFDQPFALILTVLLVVLATGLFLADRYGLFGTRPETRSDSTLFPRRMPPWIAAMWVILFVLWLVFDIRETYNQIATIRGEARYLVGGKDRSRTYFELDNFYDFMEATASVVPQGSTVGFYSSRPLFIKARYFLFPRPVSDRDPSADYLIVFQDTRLAFRSGRLTETGSTVADRLVPFARFGEDAFIYKRADD